MYRTGIIALATASYLGLCAPAHAQADGSNLQAGTELANDVIIVQARRRDESIQDVPVVVQAVTAQELQKFNIQEFEDVQSLVPGLSLSQDANGIGSQATLRGIAYDVNASGNNGTVEFYLNDSPLSASILFQSMFDVGQIEVLRGPQGTLRGRASPSGSITVTTRKPDLYEAGGYMQGTLNDIGGWNINGAINVPVWQDKLAVRIAGVVDESDDNEVRSINSSLRPFRETTGLRASVSAEPIDSLSLFFSFTNTDRKIRTFDQVESANIADSSAPDSQVFITGSDRLATMATPRDVRQRFKVYNWQAELRLAGQKVNYSGSYNSQKYNSLEPDDKGGFFGPQFPEEITAAGLRTFSQGKQQTHEIRLSNQERVAGIFDYVIGALWNKLDAPTSLTSDTLVWRGAPQPDKSNLLAFVVTPIERLGGSNERSFFGNVTAHITEATEISAGIRRIRYHSEGSISIGGVSVPGAEEDATRHATIYQASLKHRFSPNLMAYASFGTSWRPGSSTNAVIQRNNTVLTPLQQSLLFPDPEESDSYELGIKSTWLGGRLRFNLSGYYQTFDNFGYFSRNTFFASTTVNGPQTETLRGIAVGVPAKVKGAEAEINFQANDYWSIGAVLSYSKSKIKNGTVPCNDYFLPNGQLGSDGLPDASSQVPTFGEIMAVTNGGGVALCQTSSRAGFGAPFTATVQSEYAMPVTTTVDGYLRGLVNVFGDSQNDPTNPFDDISSYALVNLFAGIRDPDGAWEVGVFAKNLFDAERALLRNAAPFSLTVRTPAAANQVTTYRGVSYTAPREFGITARISLGSR